MAQILEILVAIVIVSRPALQSGQAPQHGEPPAEPVQIVDTGELMDLFLKPAYTELQQAMAAAPADRKQWATIYQKAVRLAEIENLLFFRSHEDVRKPEWVQTSARARQAAADVAAAALRGLRTVKAENYPAVRAKYNEVADTCNACHRTFARDAVTVKP
jgi:cytochrome c'